MNARIRKSMEEKDRGFTLIELLVVMIIVGVLAAIAIPVFLGQRTKAEDTATKADVANVGKEVATWFVDATACPAFAQTASEYRLGAAAGSEVKVSNRSAKVSLAFACTNSTTWTVTGTNSTSGTKTFTYTAAAGLQ